MQSFPSGIVWIVIKEEIGARNQKIFTMEEREEEQKM